jgi:hypothetical protein
MSSVSAGIITWVFGIHLDGRSLIKLFSQQSPFGSYDKTFHYYFTSFPQTIMSVAKNKIKTSELNPKTTSYEFLGPPGALFVTLVVPITTYALYFGCSEKTGGCPPALNTIPDRVKVSLSDLNWWKGLWDTEAALLYAAWYAFCVVAWAVLPGDRVEGVTMRTGEKKKYKINGVFHHFCREARRLRLTSLFNLSAHPRSYKRLHLSIWSRKLHIHLREMGRLRHCIPCHVHLPSTRGLRDVFHGGQTARSWRELWELHLRRV